MTLTMFRHPDVVHEARATALADGSLIDVSAVASKMGFRHPVAVTADVWADCVHWDDAIEEGKTGYSAEDADGRLHDLVYHALLAARRSRRSQTMFDLRRVPTRGKGAQARAVTLSMTIGPGDALEPVITIMFP